MFICIFRPMPKIKIINKIDLRKTCGKKTEIIFKECLIKKNKLTFESP